MSGIYITGMEMPTGEQGVRTINIYADGVVTNYAEEIIGKAVPVPPHGRLIDADALKKNAYPFPCAIGTEWAVTLRQINDATTIIPADPADKEGEG